MARRFGREGGLRYKGEKLQKNWKADKLDHRANSTFVVTARSSGSKMAKPSPSSFNARTLVALRGPYFSENNTRRVFPRYGMNYQSNIADGLDVIEGRKEANASLNNRKLPRSDPAARSSPNVPSLVPHSM